MTGFKASQPERQSGCLASAFHSLVVEPFLSGPAAAPWDRLRLLLRVPNHDYYRVHPPVFSEPSYEEEEEEDPCALVCFMCSEPNDDNCRCREAMDAYGQTHCTSGSCDYRRQFVAPMGTFWSKPCESCVPAYRADYAAHMATVDAARVRLADLRRQAEEQVPVFLALTAAEQFRLFAEGDYSNIVVKQILDAAKIREIELLRQQQFAVVEED